MGAPREAVVNKRDNPAHVKASRQHGIELYG